MSNKRIVNFTTCVRNSSIYDDRLLCVLNEFSVLAHGHAMCNYWSYEQKEATIMIQNTMQSITLLIAYLSAATLLVLARAMQEVYSDSDGASVSHAVVAELGYGLDVIINDKNEFVRLTTKKRNLAINHDLLQHASHTS